MPKYIIIAAIVFIVGFLNLKNNFAKDNVPLGKKQIVIQKERGVAASSGELAQLPVAQNLGPTRNQDITDPVIESRAVFIQDLESGKVLYAKKEHDRLPVASITKLMTAQVLLDTLNLDDVVTMSKTAIDTYGGQAFFIGEKISAKNLFYAMLMASSNDAAAALAEHVSGSWHEFIPLMNDRVKKLHLQNTHFANPTGLDDPENYSSASDMAIIAKESLRYSFMWEVMRTQDTIITSANGLLEHVIRNSNKLLGKLPNIGGGKTGYTDEALETFVFIAGPPREVANPDENHQVLYVLLGAPIGLRFQETTTLVHWVDKAYKW